MTHTHLFSHSHIKHEFSGTSRTHLQREVLWPHLSTYTSLIIMQKLPLSMHLSAKLVQLLQLFLHKHVKHACACCPAADRVGRYCSILQYSSVHVQMRYSSVHFCWRLLLQWLVVQDKFNMKRSHESDSDVLELGSRRPLQSTVTTVQMCQVYKNATVNGVRSSWLLSKMNGTNSGRVSQR